MSSCVGEHPRLATQPTQPNMIHTLRFPCSLKAKAMPEYGKIPKSVGVIPLKRPTTPCIQKTEKETVLLDDQSMTFIYISSKCYARQQ